MKKLFHTKSGLRRPSASLVISVVALSVAVAGIGGPAVADEIATIAKKLNGKKIKKNSVPLNRLNKKARKSLKGKPGPQGEQGVQGIQGPQGAAGATGAAGSALGYAHVNSLGGVFEADSSNVADANVTKGAAPTVGLYCIINLPFTPRNAVVTGRHSAGVNPQNATYSVFIGDDPAINCGTAENATVTVSTIDGFSTLTNAEFYIVFN